MQKWEVVQLLAQEFISAAEKEEWRTTFQGLAKCG